MLLLGGELLAVGELGGVLLLAVGEVQAETRGLAGGKVQVETGELARGEVQVETRCWPGLGYGEGAGALRLSGSCGWGVGGHGVWWRGEGGPRGVAVGWGLLGSRDQVGCRGGLSGSLGCGVWWRAEACNRWKKEV